MCALFGIIALFQYKDSSVLIYILKEAEQFVTGDKKLESSLLGIPIGIIFLSFAYVIGVMGNFIAYQFLRHFIIPTERMKIFEKYKTHNIDLRNLIPSITNENVPDIKECKCLTIRGLKNKEFSGVLFGRIRFFVFQKNILNYADSYRFDESMQRLCGGFLISLLIFLILTFLHLLGAFSGLYLFIFIVLLVFFIFTLKYLFYIVHGQNEMAVRHYFIWQRAKKNGL
jgi:hypothetical protein